MKRLVLSMASVCAVSLLSGCCWPGMWMPFGGCQSGCATGNCGPGGCPPGFGPTGYNQGVGTVQTGYPQGPVAISPYGQPIAYPQHLQPTIAVDSLPTYR